MMAKTMMAKTNSKSGGVVESPIATEMRQISATLLGVSGRDWRKKVAAVAAGCRAPWMTSASKRCRQLCSYGYAPLISSD